MNNIIVENWKKIIGYENYDVSDIGDVRNSKTGRVLKHALDGKGYYKVDLCKDGKRKTMKVHRLVAEAFIQNHENKKCVDHINNIRTDNCLTNLRFATYKENSMNASMKSNNTSGNTGVSFDKKLQKWKAHIKIDGIVKHLGYFKDKDDAVEARIKAVNSLFKEFAHSSQKR
jgi:uncharacterized protein HemY